MHTLTRYLLREFSLGSAAVFAALVVTWVAADALLHIDELGEGAEGIRAMGARALEIVPLGIPISCTVGIVWSLSQAVKSREITAIRCGGIPLRRALLPILLASIGIAVTLAFFQDRILVPTQQAIYESDLAAEAAGGPMPQHLNGRWWYASEDWIFSADEFDGKSFHGVSVFEFDAQWQVRRRIEAATAREVEGLVWELEDAVVYQFNGDGLTHKSVESMRLTLGLSGADLERARRRPTLETLHGLAQAMAGPGGDPALRLAREVAFHARLAAPFAIVILVLLAIPIAVGDVERGDSLPRALVTAIGAAGVYFLAWTLGLRSAGSGALPALAPIWGVTLIALGIGGWRYARLKE